MINFEELKISYNHNHTEHSNLRMLDCIVKVEDLIDEAIKLNSKGVCITDHCSLSSHIRAMRHIKDLRDKNPSLDFKVGYGDEIYLVDSVEDVRDNYKSGITKFPHFIIVAKDDIGYKQIREIGSKSWKNSYYNGKMERTPISKGELEEIIGDKKGHIRVSTACVGGQLAQLTLDYVNNPSTENKIEIHKFITWCISTFEKENVYVEIQPSYMTEQVLYNKTIVNIAKKYGLKVQITTDTHYLKKEDRGVHSAYLNSREGDRELADFYSTTYLMELEEMREYVSYLSDEEFVEIVGNTLDFINGVEDISMFHKTIVPERDLSKVDFKIQHIFANYYEKYDFIKKFAYSEYEQDRYFLYMIEEGFKDKKEEFNEVNIARIDVELKELWGVSLKLKERMSSYYVLVDYVVDLMWEIGYVGISRGSCSGFYTCYLVDIQQLNPIKWNLPHWRHITAERVDGLPKQYWA